MNKKRVLLEFSIVAMCIFIWGEFRTNRTSLDVMVDAKENEAVINLIGDNDIYYSIDGENDPLNMREYICPIVVEYDDYNEQLPLSSLPASNFSLNQYNNFSNFEKLLVVKGVQVNHGIKECVTKTVDINNVQNYDMDMISITIDKSDFVGDKGIYSLNNCFDYGKDASRDAYMEYFNSKGEVVLSQEIKIKIAGHSSRDFLQKSFRIWSKNEIEVLEYSFFEGIENTTSINLKNGGNNCEGAKFQNSVMHELARMSGCVFATQMSKPVTVYINGEYWGCYVLTEDYDKSFFYNHYDIEDEVILLSAMGDSYDVKEGYDKDVRMWEEVIKYAKTYPMNDERYYNKICKMIDVDSFAEWLAFEVYIGNTDVSSDYGDNNTYVWRTRKISNEGESVYADGKWRWMLQDADNSFDITWETNNMDRLLNNGDNSATKVLFTSLIMNEHFRELFINQLYRMQNEVFTEDKCIEVWNKNLEIYEEELVKTFKRFGVDNRMDDITMYKYRLFEQRSQIVDSMVHSINKYVHENGGD